MIAVEWLADSTVISSAVTSIPCPSSDRAVGEEVAQQEVPKKENLENLSVAVEKCSDQTTEEAVKQGMSEKMGEAKDKRIIGCEGLATGEEIVERELPKKGNPESKSGTVVDCSAQTAEEAVKQGMSEKMGEAKDKRIIGCEGLATGEEIVERELPKKGNPESKSGTVVDCSAQMTEEPVKQGMSEKIGEAKDKRIIPQFIPEMNEWWEKQKKRCRGILTISIYPPSLPAALQPFVHVPTSKLLLIMAFEWYCLFFSTLSGSASQRTFVWRHKQEMNVQVGDTGFVIASDQTLFAKYRSFQRSLSTRGHDQNMLSVHLRTFITLPDFAAVWVALGFSFSLSFWEIYMKVTRDR